MRGASAVLGAAGVVLMVAAALWLLIAPGQLIKYPNDVDKTIAARGTITLYMDPSTGAPLAQPRTLPLSIQRRLHVVASTSSLVTVQETSTERAAPLPVLEFQQRYLLDRRSMRNEASPAAYAYTADNAVDRSPAYSINLPLNSGSGPYNVWKNEAGRAYAFKRAGDSVERDGVTLVPYTGTLVNAPASTAYVSQLGLMGIPKQLSLSQLTAMLKQQGNDPSSVAGLALPAFSRGDRGQLEQLLAKPIPLAYRVSVSTRVLVEPGTGTIVSLDRIGQTFSATVDLSGLGLTAPSPVKVFEISYGQTPASVADIAAYASDQANGKTMVEAKIPLTAATAGATAMMAGVILRRRPRVLKRTWSACVTGDHS